MEADDSTVLLPKSRVAQSHFSIPFLHVTFVLIIDFVSPPLINAYEPLETSNRHARSTYPYASRLTAQFERVTVSRFQPDLACGAPL